MGCIIANLNLTTPNLKTNIKFTADEKVLTIEERIPEIKWTKSVYTLRLEEEARQEELRRQQTKQRYVLSRDSSYKVIAVDYTNNCVAWAKKETGIYRPLGYGGRGYIQGTEPKVGSIGSLYGIPHAVVVKNIDGNMITFWESNYHRNVITERTLSISSFIGFIYN